MTNRPATWTALAGLLALGAITPARAQEAAQPLPAIPYTRVAEALAALAARDGNGTVVTHADGWTTVNEPMASAQWSFTPAGHPAHPALVRRIVERQPVGELRIDVQTLCESPSAAACAQLRSDFEAMNDRIRQAMKARGRMPQQAR
ncbi:hypothetical protein [Leptothrix discophora]|uniref:Molecular chaperone DnaJ n=1 Tax=Leptothrix discophora TaxID=89 RepID=A0ABT9G5Q8_LEPDI|nr:hypothetical protein [Leptothrix discophora]MDP4301829.1 hypothetical protein [Leptothrix discophora]